MAISRGHSHVGLADPYGEASTREIVSSFQREIDTASACIKELHAAVARADRDQIVAIGFSLHAAWWRARTIVIGLELVSRQVETLAREALQHSREFAREPLARALSLLRPEPGAPGQGGRP